MYRPAITGSMRLVTSIASVMAGLRCPETRIVALTKTARINPCANAATTSAALVCAAWAAMIEPEPMNTSAKMPTNSAVKCRTGSFIVSVARGFSVLSVSALQQHGRVDAAEAERIAEDELHFPGASFLRDVVQVAA